MDTKELRAEVVSVMPPMKDIQETTIRTAVNAGRIIMGVYEEGVGPVDLKADNSPLTRADRESHRLIISTLSGNFGGIPVLSEEGRGFTPEERRKWNRYFCVDPLDGTREFIGGNGQFTVNIAYVENGTPVFGVVYAPVGDTVYWGGRGADPCRLKTARRGVENARDMDELLSKAERLHSGDGAGPVRIIASRSHKSRETGAFIEAVRRDHPDSVLTSIGSALKLCRIAEGAADLYPRFAPTMEWDTAAGHAVVNASGGSVMRVDGDPLAYNKEDLVNPWFVACSSRFSRDEIQRVLRELDVTDSLA